MAAGAVLGAVSGTSALQPQQSEIIQFPTPQNPNPRRNPIPSPFLVPNQTEEDRDIPLFRSGGNTPSNFTPRTRDTTGLSLFSTPPAGGNYQVTTLNTLRRMGWIVVNDHGNHFLVRPPDSSMMLDWMASRSFLAGLTNNNWNNPNIHPLTRYLHAAFWTRQEWEDRYCE